MLSVSSEEFGSVFLVGMGILCGLGFSFTNAALRDGGNSSAESSDESLLVS